MSLLYISYWSVDDVLTKATVFPNLKVLAKYFPVIYLATIERQKRNSADIPEDVHHVPYHSFTNFPRFIEKVTDILFFSWKLLRLSRKAKVDLVICRGAMAATFGVFIFKIFRIPFMVESFEPHADYMLESGTWGKNSLEYRFQKWIENQTIQHAAYLLPVSNGYAEYLKSKLSVQASRIIVMPCAVNISEFLFSSTQRNEIRSKLELGDDSMVGIYVGKFGDIYLDDEAFEVFRDVFSFFKGNFFLIILTPHDKTAINLKLNRFGISKGKVFVGYVDHRLVPGYLSAADFAFSLIRPSFSRRFCSPIKNGEYWANGLPILSTKNIGDDSDIILNNQAGAILDENFHNLDSCLHQILSIIQLGRPSLAIKFSDLAVRFRNFDIIQKGYNHIFASSNFKNN